MGYNAGVTFDEAERLHVTGHYKEVLEEALREQSQAVVVARNGRPEAVLTRSDLLEYLAHRR